MLARPLRRAVTIAMVAGAVSSSLPAAAAGADEPVARTPAREPSPFGPRIALRSGVAVPIGAAYVAGGPLSDTITGYVPLRIDVGYRLAGHFYIGADAQLATILPNQCPSGGSCSGSNLRFGFMAAYHLFPGGLVDPWVGVGMGFERLGVSRTIDGTRGEISARGLELLDLDLGADIRPTRSLRIGPVLSSSLGRYTSVAVNGVATSDFDPSLHAWVLIGFRGAYDL